MPVLLWNSIYDVVGKDSISQQYIDLFSTHEFADENAFLIITAFIHIFFLFFLLLFLPLFSFSFSLFRIILLSFLLSFLFFLLLFFASFLFVSLLSHYFSSRHFHDFFPTKMLQGFLNKISFFEQCFVFIGKREVDNLYSFHLSTFF